MAVIPDFTDIVGAMIASNRKTMFGGWLPGRIETYDPTRNKASVQLLLLETNELEGGTEELKPIAIINDVPVVTIGDHYGVRIEVTLQKGDLVTVFFASRSVDRWLQRGGMIDPGDERDHDLNDALALPGLFSFNAVTKPTAKIKFTSSQVQIGGTSALALAAELNSLRSTFNSHVHGGVNTGGGTSAVPTSPVGSSYPGTDVLKGG
jgi:hypothetical protein